MTLRHRRHQHPVGHGGFHTAQVEWRLSDPFSDFRPFHYVYDCGAKSRHRVERRIEQYVRQYLAGDQIDALFVSHLHYDHVSGLPMLLDHSRPRYVFLPYLSPLDRVSIVAAHLVEGVDADVAQIAIDPQGWFTERADQVVFIRSGGPDLGEFPAPEGGGPGEPPVDTEEPWPIKLPRDSQQEDQTDSPSGSPSEGRSQVISDKQPIVVGRRTWLFAPYVARTDDDRSSKFHDALSEKLPDLFNALAGSGPSASALAKELNDVLSTISGRRRLARCYKAAFGDDGLNRTSLCLYAGPAFARRWHTHRPAQTVTVGDVVFYVLSEREFSHERIGWLGTGDAELGTRYEFGEFESHYSDLLRSTWTLGIPHHGSINNYHPDLIAVTQPNTVFACCPQSGGKGKHPDPSVVADLKSQGYELVVVAENDGGLVEKFELERWS